MITNHSNNELAAMRNVRPLLHLRHLGELDAVTELRHPEQNACLRKFRRLWSDVIAKNPNAWSAHVNLGNAFLQVGKIQDAVVEYEAALKIEPFLAEPHNNLGTILIRSGQLPEAIVHYEQALRIKLDYPEAQNNLGLALMGAGEFAAAVQHLKAAIQLNPNYGEARYNRP